MAGNSMSDGPIAQGGGVQDGYGTPDNPGHTEMRRDTSPCTDPGPNKQPAATDMGKYESARDALIERNRSSPSQSLSEINKHPAYRPGEDADKINAAELERTLAGKANPPAEQVRPVGDSRNNVMRHDYPPLNTTEVTAMRLIKDRGLELWELFDTIGRTDLSGGAGASTDDSAQQAPPNGSRELSLAKTKVEEAVMWATKHISR